MADERRSPAPGHRAVTDRGTKGSGAKPTGNRGAQSEAVTSAPYTVSAYLPPLCPYIRVADRDARPPWRTPPHRFLDYLLVGVEHGRCRFVVEGQDYRLEPPQVCLIQPGDSVILEGLTQTVAPYVHCDLFPQPGAERRSLPSPDFLDLGPYRPVLQPRLSDFLQVELSPVVEVPNPTDFLEQLTACVRCWQSGRLLDRLEANALLGHLLVIALRACLSDQSAVPRIPAALQQLDRYLRLHLHETVTVDAMAKHVGVSAVHLTRLCRLYWRQSPHQRLVSVRLEHARMLLHNPELSLSQVADYCGFADAHHFGRVFRKAFGCSPTHARLRVAGPLPMRP